MQFLIPAQHLLPIPPHNFIRGKEEERASGSQLGCALNPKPYKERRMSVGIVLWLFCSYSCLQWQLLKQKVQVEEI
jgi:hypothetical protein